MKLFGEILFVLAFVFALTAALGFLFTWVGKNYGPPGNDKDGVA